MPDLSPVAVDIVSTAPSLAFCAAISLYIAASTLLLASLAFKPKWVGRVGLVLVVLAFCAHGVDIGWRGVEKVHPGTSVREALGFLAWIVVGAYLVIARRPGLRVLGSFIAPLATVVLAVARLSPSGQPLTGLTSLGRLHIATATLGLAIFTLATLVAIVYLLQERNLKSKNFDGVLFRSSAALETLDRLNSRLIGLGFPIFTISMMLGAFWVTQREQNFNRMEYPLAAVAWLAFATLVFGRVLQDWRGRRAALLTLVGFAGAVLVLGSYLIRRWVGA